MPLGFRLQGVSLVMVLARESVRLLISSLLGVTALGTYQLADRLLLVARSPGLAVLSPLMPAFSGLAAGGEVEKGRRLFARASTVMAVCAALSMLFIAVFADTILRAWIGNDVPDAAWTVRVLAPAEFAAALTGVAIAGLRASGTVGLELRFAVATGVLVLTGVVAGNLVAAYAGGIVAFALGRGAAALWFLWRLPPSWTLERWARRTLVFALLTAAPAVGLAKMVSFGLPIPSGRWMAAVELGVLAVGSALTVAALTWMMLPHEDREAFRRGARG
jgi:O-antigen/teichoic acid export membrane protein